MSKIQRVYYLLYVDCIEQSLTIWDWHCSVIIFNGLPNGPTDKNVLLMRKFRSENDSWLRGFCVILTDILSFQLSWASDQNYVNYRILFNIKPDIRIPFIRYKLDHTRSCSITSLNLNAVSEKYTWQGTLQNAKAVSHSARYTDIQEPGTLERLISLHRRNLYFPRLGFNE